jgi:hypothetical protein
MEFKFNDHIIKAITIKQPWANLIVMGIKDIENRSWVRKNYNDVCKNWLLVHSSSKPESKNKLKKVKSSIKDQLNKVDINSFPNSAIIGMMHIHNIGKLSDSVNPTLWAEGPNCWYIDSVIQFDTPIISSGSLGQWSPPENLHNKIHEQIIKSMYNIKFLDNIEFVKKSSIYYATQRGSYMKWIDVINSLKGDIDTFKYKLIYLLLQIKYKAYFWECDRVILNKPFRFAIFDSKTLAKKKQDNNAFKGIINCSKNAIDFPSLTKDVHLVVPCNKNSSTIYTSIATFSRTANIHQQYMFWKKVGQNIKEGDWVSTSGLGVYWLHVRIATRPKYYHNLFLKQKNNNRTIMENYIENFNFPKNFNHIVVISKGKMKQEYNDFINYYFELLPKDTTIISSNSFNNKTLKDIADSVHLKSQIFSSNWKKYGRFGGNKRDTEMLQTNPHLVTVFLIEGENESYIIEQSKQKGIPILTLTL